MSTLWGYPGVLSTFPMVRVTAVTLTQFLFLRLVPPPAPPMSGEPDGILKGYSPALRLSLCWDNEMLRFYDPQSGEYLRNFEAEQARADSEQAARERAEARVRELQEELELRAQES